MEKQDFLKFVESFNRKPGEYTDDEVYQIGVEHKKLRQVDKSWQTLADLIGWRGSKDSLRAFVAHRQLQDDSTLGFQSKNTDEIQGDFAGLYTEKTKVRDSWNAYRRTLRDEARLETFIESIKECADSFGKLVKVDYKGEPKKSKKEAVLLLSDLHIGPEFINSYNAYNINIANQRMSKLVSDVINYCKVNNVYRLNVLNMGDLIAGNIHLTIRLEQQMDVIDQTLKAAELVAQALNQLQLAAPEVVYRSVVDNHSRVNPDKNQHIEKESFNRIIDVLVEERLKGTKIKFPKDNLDIGIGKFDLMNGKKVMFAHGHQDSIDKSFQSFFGVTREFIDYICLAHYHNSKEKTFNGMKVFVNGSIIGCDTYAYSKRLFGEPEQKLLIFDDTNNVIDVDINLK